MTTEPAPHFVPPGYRVRQLLGSGQTSSVYVAEHNRLGRVALKLPRTGLQERPVLRRMFENEVQMTMALKHPNVVAAYEGHPTGERAFLALEYCPGGTLDGLLLERGKLPLESAYRLVADVAGGLAHSHEHKVLHRDIKPANVFLTEDGRAKLGDFGTGVFLTEVTTDRVGTAFYMAPEVFQGESATARSDVYSLGILAYEVIGGARPFAGESFEALLMAHLSGFPKNLRHLRPELPPAVARVVSHAMAREAEKRYAGAGAFLEAFVQAAGLSVEPPQDTPVVGRAGRIRNTREQRDEDEKEKPRGLMRWFGRKKG